METDLIDLIYKNEEVEGLAIFDANNDLVENQLTLTQSKVLVIADTLFNLKNALHNAGRQMLGFLIKSDTILLHVIISPDKLILLELSEGSSVNALDGKIRSVLGSNVPQGVKPVAIQPAESTSPEPAQVQPAQARPKLALPEIRPAQPNQAITPEPVDKVAEGIDFAIFKQGLQNLLKSVAPGKLSDNMIDSAMKDMGIAADVVQLPEEVATELGFKVIDKIPNKARRKMIINEYNKMLGK